MVDTTNFINIKVIHLKQPLPIQGFNRQPGSLVTYIIILYLKVVGCHLKDLPILIVELR